jgi:signal transduction histidine kinase
VEESFAEIEDVAQQALKEMRLLIFELRPPALANEGLQGALHHRLSAVEKRAGVEARLLTDEVLDLPSAVEEALYAIAVEALNNALKHAAATHVTVRLLVEDGCIKMEVADNGRGFDPQKIEETGGMGLKSMRERVAQLNGDLEIISQPGAGTRVKVEVTA